jgi:hypothetical protein
MSEFLVSTSHVPCLQSILLQPNTSHEKNQKKKLYFQKKWRRVLGIMKDVTGKLKKKKKMKRKENGEVERQFREKHKAVHYSTPVSPF